jgi:hypothetical protein
LTLALLNTVEEMLTLRDTRETEQALEEKILGIIARLETV